MPIALYRIDDRLIHGQVVVGWGQPLELRFIVLVDDDVAGSEWEQELYRMGVPPEMTVHFATVEDATAKLAQFEQHAEPGIVLVGISARCCDWSRAPPGAFARSMWVACIMCLAVPGASGTCTSTPSEEQALRDIAAQGVEVTAQDVPSARPVPLEELLHSTVGV